MVQMFNQDLSNDQYRRFLESQVTGILWLDEGLRLRYCTPAAGTLLELVGQPHQSPGLASLFPENGEFLAILKRVVESRETLTRRELGLVVGAADTRHRVTVDCTVSPLSESQDAPDLLVELAPLDRHLRISREAALSTQSHLNRRLARNLAHEIKNPLGGIRGAAQLLGRKLTQPVLTTYTNLIVSEADRLAALVDALLGPWRPASYASVNLHELMEHVAQLTQTAALKTRIVRDYDPSLPELWLDRDQIVQALLNLAKNAREAVGRRGRITFRTRALRQFTLNGTRHRLVACADIEDDGPGIPEEILPQLFTPLASRKPQGSGLGLSIAQELVSRHGGLIEYQSLPGHTIFSVLLPLEAQHA